MPKQPSEPNLSQLSRPFREFAQQVLQAFPEWEGIFECHGVDDCWFCVASPLHPEHRLCIETRGSNSVEIRYHDARPPGPAEKLFVDLDQQPKEVAAAVVGFVRDLFANRVVVVRKRVGRLTRLLRRDCDSVARFQRADDLECSRTKDVIAVYSWGSK